MDDRGEPVAHDAHQRVVALDSGMKALYRFVLRPLPPVGRFIA
jgi:hypothetical protein